MSRIVGRVVRLPTSLWLFVSEVVRGMLFAAFERFAPVRRRRWAFATWPGKYAHTLDNPRAVFEEVKNDPAIEKVILRKRGQDPATVIPEGKNVRFVDIESLQGAWMLATCEVLLTGYALGALCSYNRWLTRKHHIIQLWHGVPLKRIGKLFPGETQWDNETHKYAATVCSSETDQQIMAAAFAPLSLERTWLTGLPRNDLLLKDEIELPADYRREIVRLRSALDGRRLVLYAPTWRDAATGTYDFTDQESGALNSVLSQHNAILGIRAHSNRRPQNSSSKGGMQTLYLNDYPDVSILLRETSVLITDYSSIFIDFLITGRPCLFFAYDLDSYVSERGFLYDYPTVIPRSYTSNSVQLLADLDSVLADGTLGRERHAQSIARFHTHLHQPSSDVIARIHQLSTSKQR